MDLARPQEHLSTPSARRCRLLCVLKYYYSQCCCAVYHSQAEFLVVSPPLSPASSPRTLQRWPNGGGYRGWDNRFLSSPRRPSSYQGIWSPCTLVCPELSTSRVYTNVGHGIFHHSEKSSPVSFCFGRSRLFFLYVRLIRHLYILAVGTGSTYSSR